MRGKVKNLYPNAPTAERGKGRSHNSLHRVKGKKKGEIPVSN